MFVDKLFGDSKSNNKLSDKIWGESKYKIDEYSHEEIEKYNKDIERRCNSLNRWKSKSPEFINVHKITEREANEHRMNSKENSKIKKDLEEIEWELFKLNYKKELLNNRRDELRIEIDEYNKRELS